MPFTKEKRKLYEQTEAYKKRRKLYEQTEAYKKRRKLYEQTEAYKERNRNKFKLYYNIKKETPEYKQIQLIKQVDILLTKTTNYLDKLIEREEHNKQIILKKEETIRRNKEKKKENYRLNKDKIKEELNKHRKGYSSNRCKLDFVYRMRKRLSETIRRYLKEKGYTKKSRTYEIIGLDYNSFKTYIESKFEPWMNWDNHGLYNGELNYGWDIDHIIPISSADSEQDILKLNHYTNLQPLDSFINRYVKKDKIIA